VVVRQAVAVAVANTRKRMIKFRVARRTRKMALKARNRRWRSSKKVMTLLTSRQADELDVADTLRRSMVKFGLSARPKRMKHIAALKMKKLPVTLVEEYLHRQLQEDQGYVQAEDDNPAPEVAIAAVVAEIRRPIAHAVPDDPMNGEEVDDPIEYEEGFIPWGDVILSDVHRKISALYMPSLVNEDSFELKKLTSIPQAYHMYSSLHDKHVFHKSGIQSYNNLIIVYNTHLVVIVNVLILIFSIVANNQNQLT
jgi:hypothetical protein